VAAPALALVVAHAALCHWNPRAIDAIDYRHASSVLFCLCPVPMCVLALPPPPAGPAALRLDPGVLFVAWSVGPVSACPGSAASVSPPSTRGHARCLSPSQPLDGPTPSLLPCVWALPRL
jgi:hypothetical protein